MIELTLPPSVNHIYKKDRYGNIYKTADGKRWMEYAAWEIKLGSGKFAGPVSVSAKVFFGDKKRRDL